MRFPWQKKSTQKDAPKCVELLDKIMLTDGVFDYGKAMTRLRNMKSELGLMEYINLVDACNLIYRRTQSNETTLKTIGEMQVGETGYIVPWAVRDWNWLPYPEHLDGLNLGYFVYPNEGGTVDTLIKRTETGWLVDKKLFKEPK